MFHKCGRCTSPASAKVRTVSHPNDSGKCAGAVARLIRSSPTAHGDSAMRQRCATQRAMAAMRKPESEQTRRDALTQRNVTARQWGGCKNAGVRRSSLPRQEPHRRHGSDDLGSSQTWAPRTAWRRAPRGATRKHNTMQPLHLNHTHTTNPADAPDALSYECGARAWRRGGLRERVGEMRPHGSP